MSWAQTNRRFIHRGKGHRGNAYRLDFRLDRGLQRVDFSLMMIGILVAFWGGILPGLSGPTARALKLPFILKMTALEAFAFLLAMTAVTATTGDITSVLFGVPGEPTTASTPVDGHGMARNGDAGRVLGAVLMSSLIGVPSSPPSHSRSV